MNIGEFTKQVTQFTKMAMTTVIIMLLIAGCATSEFGTARDGGAVYSYTKSQDGTLTIHITSSRGVEAGRVEIRPDGAVFVVVDKAAGSGDTARVLEKTVEKLP